MRLSLRLVNAAPATRNTSQVRILVLGGTGFIGPKVVHLLAVKGHEVTVFHRGATETELPANVHHVHDDFGALSEHIGRLRAWRPDVILDMVPFIDKQGHGVRHFRGLARRATVITSCDVYRAFGRLWGTEPGPPDAIPLHEESPLREKRAGDVGPGTDYDNVEVEAAVGSDSELPLTILRLPATHGPGDPQHRLFPYVKRMDDGRSAILLDEAFARWHWPRGYVENVAAAIALGVEDDRAAGRVYNVCDSVSNTELEWVRRIGAVVGWEGEVLTVPNEALPLSLRVSLDFDQDYTVDSSRIRRELGYRELVPEDEALGRTIEWERRNPPEAGALTIDYEAEDKAIIAVSDAGL